MNEGRASLPVRLLLAALWFSILAGPIYFVGMVLLSLPAWAVYVGGSLVALHFVARALRD